MSPRRTSDSKKFGRSWGGSWTLKKLEILERYLNFYTTALKDRPFELWYIDAFAGSGRIKLSGDKEMRGFVEGSAARAIGIQDKPFDKLVFVENDVIQYNKLQELAKSHRNRNIDIKHDDANEYLAGFDANWGKVWRRGMQRRGVLFLDPYATQVAWTTIEKIAGLEALDTWILFPTSALSRMLPTGKMPDEGLAKSLTRVYGDDSWQALYQPPRQWDLFEDEEKLERDSGVNGLLRIYKKKLQNLFGNRFLQTSYPLTNSKNSVLFEFMFCAGHPRGAKLAHDTAQYLVEKL